MFARRYRAPKNDPRPPVPLHKQFLGKIIGIAPAIHVDSGHLVTRDMSDEEVTGAFEEAMPSDRALQAHCMRYAEEAFGWVWDMSVNPDAPRPEYITGIYKPAV
eukprot:GHVT01070638.1.p1 GENE.GHVT01070638.1~~GHVT01070638.1.p1  ORF type:complete len:104 (-),score=15.40 GHVT01070638.1:160-471(-)